MNISGKGATPPAQPRAMVDPVVASRRTRPIRLSKNPVLPIPKTCRKETSGPMKIRYAPATRSPTSCTARLAPPVRWRCTMRTACTYGRTARACFPCGSNGKGGWLAYRKNPHQGGTRLGLLRTQWVPTMRPWMPPCWRWPSG